ncbi:MAG: hypothetical protein HC880_00850 [Bacteroidia bacterium]|nr:hypothetical protein [Bacteroidia bacterium]
MKSYIGAKIIKAEPMDRHDFLREQAELNNRPWGTDQENAPGYKVQYEDGYVSWSPKEVFERCYREITEKERYLITGI